jgi:hypothetical protein
MVGCLVLCFALPRLLTAMDVNSPFSPAAETPPPTTDEPVDEPVVVVYPSPAPSPTPAPTPPPKVRVCYIPLEDLGGELSRLGDRSVPGGFSGFAIEYRTSGGTVIGEAELAEALDTLSGAEVSAVIPFGGDAVPLMTTAFEAGFSRVILSGVGADQLALLTGINAEGPVDVWLDGADIPADVGSGRVYIRADVTDPFIPVVAAGVGASDAFLLVEEW